MERGGLRRFTAQIFQPGPWGQQCGRKEVVLGGADKPSRPHRKGGSCMLLLDPAFHRNLGPGVSPRACGGRAHRLGTPPRQGPPLHLQGWGRGGGLLQGPQGNPGSGPGCWGRQGGPGSAGLTCKRLWRPRWAPSACQAGGSLTVPQPGLRTFLFVLTAQPPREACEAAQSARGCRPPSAVRGTAGVQIVPATEAQGVCPL